MSDATRKLRWTRHPDSLHNHLEEPRRPSGFRNRARIDRIGCRFQVFLWQKVDGRHNWHPTAEPFFSLEQAERYAETLVRMGEDTGD